MQKWMVVFLMLGCGSVPAMAEEVFEPEEVFRQGPATATDKLVDRFMQLNTSPETSAGVSFEEYLMMVHQRAEERFADMDANHDEEVTAKEYRNYWTSRKAQWYRLKH